MDAYAKLKAHLPKIRVPCDNQAIYKDECMYSFDNPETATGLYISLSTFLGFGEDYVKRYAEKTGNAVFLHIQREKFLKNDADNAGTAADKSEEAGPERKITRLAIGIEGGYNDADAKKYDYKDTYYIFVAPDTKLPYPDTGLPLLVTQAVESLLAQDSAIAKLEKQTLTGTWDGEVRMVSLYSRTLKQLDNGKKIPPSGWKCEKCDLTSNLWLNLTDGSILCGRKFFDGSGGNDHAVEYFKEKGYPLAVKLGTITADGKSDVFSYAEDDMVIDEKLEEHLAHFGINMAAMKKSEKSMVELELEINQRIGEWSLLTESDSELKPLSGPGYTGMRNLGNSCYINSVMQVLFTLPDFKKRFVNEGAENYFKEFPSDPANDFNIQMAKLGNGLWSGKYSTVTENSLDSETTGVSPAMFKNIIGKNHPEFSTKQQQDACEFYLHLISLLERNSRGEMNPIDALKLSVEERIECMTSKKVRYSRRDEYCLPLQIPLEKATNLDEVKAYLERKAAAGGNVSNDKDVVRHKVTLSACLEQFFAAEMIDQFFSSAINGVTTAKKTTRLATMPDYLMMHLRKFTLGDDWAPKKLDVLVQMPDVLDVTNWRATGLQANEEQLPDTEVAQAKEFVFDEGFLSELLQMGFPQEACKRAVYHTKNSNIDSAVNWLMEHIGDADISDPFVVPTERVGGGKEDNFIADPESLATLMSMGFPEHRSREALRATNGNLERSMDWIFSHNSDMAAEESTTEPNSSTNAAVSKTYRDGSGKYKLVAFISHMGTSSQVGHYVCHIKKEGQWVIFNDSKVALSQNPPKDLGYLYLYQREN